MKMRSNFHTHTFRCGHAEGTEREYIEAAIKAGIKTLGFSDHTPQIFGTDYVSPVRMTVDKVFDYAETINALKKEYEKDIKIYLGFEAEYYPKCFSRLLDLYRQINPDYVILGQHSADNEYDGELFLNATDDEKILAKYAAQVIEALDTGVFSYVAHPDAMNFTGYDITYEKYMLAVCEKAKAKDIPLEVNFLGLANGRHYPTEKFWRCAKAVGNKVIFGIDAHSVDEIEKCAQTEERALKFLEPSNLEITDKIKNLRGETI